MNNDTEHSFIKHSAKGNNCVFMKVRQCLNPSWQRKVFVSSQWKQKVRSIATAILKYLSLTFQSPELSGKKISWAKFPWFDDEIKVNCGFCVLGFVFLSILHGVLYWHALHSTFYWVVWSLIV